MAEKESTPAGHEDDAIIQGHSYDGIHEYDNPMPGWWLWMLWASIIWSPLYILGVHFSDVIPTYQEDLASSQAEILQIREAFEAANPTFEATAETLAPFIGNQDHITAGAALFSANCAACHRPDGGGLIGPNLTDEFWIHGHTDVDIFNIITAGVISKGMAPWGPILSDEERAQLVAYVRSLEGSSPPGALAPQGDPVTADTDDV